MSLDHHDNPPTPDELIQYGRDDLLSQLSRAARQEADKGDGRAVRVLARLVEACGMRRKGLLQDDGN